MPTPRSVINLPVHRLEQIRTIASHRGVSIPDLVSMWIARDNADLGIEGAMKAYVTVTYEVTEAGPQIIADLNDLRLTGEPEAIRNLAGHIERVATSGGMLVDLDHGLTIRRQGGGVKLIQEIERKGRKPKIVEMTVSAEIAKSIAKELKGAVAEAPGTKH